MIALVTTLIVALIGWVIIFFINKHFYKLNKNRSEIDSIIARLDKILTISLNFWQNPNHISNYSDQQELSIQFKIVGRMLRDLDIKDTTAIEILHKAKRKLTSTPIDIIDFSDMDKSSKVFHEVFSDGERDLYQLMSFLNSKK